MNRPTFFLVGHSKSGTSAMHAFLDAHPDLFMCAPKEPNYFARDFCRGVTRGAYAERTEAEYLALFRDASPFQRCGEASACYLYSRVAADEIYAFEPEARILIMLREPVAFLHAFHLQRLRNPPTEGENVKDFEQALRLEEARKAGRHIPPGCLTPQHLYYSERIKYREQVERYTRRFGLERVKVIIYDDFKDDNEAVYRDVLTFLEVEPTFTPAFGIHNRGVRVRSKPMQELVHTVSHGRGPWRGVHALVKAAVPGAVRRTLLRTVYRKLVFAPKPDLDPDLVRRLKAIYRPEVERISAFLDIDLVSRWGYDGVTNVE